MPDLSKRSFATTWILRPAGEPLSENGLAQCRWRHHCPTPAESQLSRFLQQPVCRLEILAAPTLRSVRSFSADPHDLSELMSAPKSPSRPVHSCPRTQQPQASASMHRHAFSSAHFGFFRAVPSARLMGAAPGAPKDPQPTTSLSTLLTFALSRKWTSIQLCSRSPTDAREIPTSVPIDALL